MNINLNQQQPSRIIGIQFSMMTSEDIRKSSVVEIVTKDTYIGNKPAVGGLFDPRMGVLEKGYICPTDGLTYNETPGYQGHIELAKPVYWIQHISTIRDICGCICIKCGKCLVSAKHHSKALELPAEDRFAYVKNLCANNKIKRCGEKSLDGCKIKQPSKIKHEQLANLIAVWDSLSKSDSGEEKNQMFILKLTPEIVLRLFKRISDEDITFMGFHPVWARPEAMICSVLPVAPPSVRPSVKQAQQRSEDDLTFIYSNIFKTNIDLMKKIGENAPVNIIEGMSNVLQYFVAMIVNNKVKGASPITQRSGRPLQCITGRLNTKHGRIRGNLMGKRVNYSARSVITGDPNLSIRQLGVPMKIAMNLTSPVLVNERNKDFLTKLVQNGPDVWPGAKTVKKKGEIDPISLRNVDRNSIQLRIGDEVHRHIMDGDAVLFNRQPSLHKMSANCHIVKVMSVGDTFRMNVADTKPYNADFDGDEMNMHISQNILADVELRILAAIPYQIVSPVGVPIIGIFQDSLLGSYRFTSEKKEYSSRDAMNLLMRYSKVNPDALHEAMKVNGKITNFDILSQILPPMSLKYNGKGKNVLEIRNGKYISGQMDKSILGGGTKGIIHRINNDFGNMASSNFIDDLQNIVTEYMKSSSYSVGVNDLIASSTTYENIANIMATKKREVQAIMDKIHLGIFKNNTAYSNMAEFETQVNNILNAARDETGNEAQNSLRPDNRFLMIVNSGSKGTMVNISQMIACLGQTNVDGKRIPYGFDNRTLPHYTKYDDSAEARGFVENSFISGLSAQEVFFHAMGGRIGLIDTAVKSVSWETPVVFMENGKARYVEIGSWIDGRIDDVSVSNKIQHFEARNMELLETAGEGIYIPTTDADGNVSWGEVTAMTRHDPGDILYEIKTNGGRSVIVTESKSLLIWNEEKEQFIEMLTPDIRVGDCVPVTAYLCEPPSTVSSLWNGEYSLSNVHKSALLLAFYCVNADEKRPGFPVTIFKKHIVVDEETNTRILPDDLLLCSTEFIREFLWAYVKVNGHLEKDTIVVQTNNIKNGNIIALLSNRIGTVPKIKGTVLRYEKYWGNILNLVKSRVPLFPNYQHNDTIDESITISDVLCDSIVSITKVSVENHPKMYDLTIPSTLNFGLANGLQVRDTSTTGYIQRRLIKGLEDLKVEYDMTVRNSQGKIVQFRYGDDGIESTRSETQAIPLVEMSLTDIYNHYDVFGANNDSKTPLTIYDKSTSTRIRNQKDAAMKRCRDLIDVMTELRNQLVVKVFKNKNENMVHSPVAFQYIIGNIRGQLNLNESSVVDITPLEAFALIDECFESLVAIHYAPPTDLFKTLFYFYLTPKDLLIVKRFNKKALQLLLETVILKYKQSIVHPGEMVGVVAGQSLGEPTTQLTLNSVTYETEIVVKNNKNEIRKVQIGEFIHKQIEKSKKVEELPTALPDRIQIYAELDKEQEYYEVPSANEAGETVWRRIEAVTKHPVINEDGTNTMLKITTKGCREITVTKAKSVLQLIDGKIQGINGKDIRVGEYLPCSIKPLRGKDITVLELHDTTIQLDYDFGYLFGAYCIKGCISESQISIKNNNQNDKYFIPINRWCDKHKINTNLYSNSSEIHINSSVLCDILKELSDDRTKIDDRIVFSNDYCRSGFMDAYACVTDVTTFSSVYYTMLLDIQVLLKNMEIISNINQPNVLTISHDYDLYDIPNKITTESGEFTTEWIKRNNKYKDTIFDEIISIEEVPNTTDFAYDLTVEDTRNFDVYNGCDLVDTFHLSGVASKSNVTRGVPRIEEILRLTKSQKNSSMTVFLKELDRENQDKANYYSKFIEHTKLVDVVKNMQICFDPNESVSSIHEDDMLLKQYREFETMIQECLGGATTTELATIVPHRSKWIVRMEIDREKMLDKNITMDDIHLAIKQSKEGEHITCVFSDYNQDKLIFRIRMNSAIFAKKKKAKGLAQTLDQSDEIYLLKNFQDNVLNNIVLRGITGVENVIPRKLKDLKSIMVEKSDGKFSERKDIWILDTTGTNLLHTLALDYIDPNNTYSNDIQEMFDVFGIEVARQVIYNEFEEVMSSSGVYIDYHHLSVLADRMTNTYNMVAIYRSGLLKDNVGIISKSTFEEHANILMNASKHAEFDNMRGVSANVMTGQYGFYGTNSFNVLLDTKKVMERIGDKEITDETKEMERFEKLLGNEEEGKCSVKNIRILNNVNNLKSIPTSNLCLVEDGYDVGF